MSKPNTIRIVGAVLDSKQLLLYRADGNTISILQGDIRLQPTLDSVVPQINRQGWAEIKEEHTSSYAGFEKKTGIKLFRITRDLVKHLFSSDEERDHVPVNQELTVGTVPTVPTSQPTGTVQSKAQGEGLLTSAKPIADDMSPIQQDETVVAVVGDQVVPGMEMLKGQFDHIQRNNSEKGLKALIERLGPMINQRGHSVEDILKFLEKADLPIADDGTIIAYKVLTTSSKSTEFSARDGLFFDCHTGKVPQQVGSFVKVDESLVDKNRRNECSNGLHIARRAYIGNFSGNVLTLCKIAPEDIITVPHGDPNKVRVCGYHIIAQLSDADHATLRRNKPMTDNDEAQILLARAIYGHHIGRVEEVRITQQYGGGIVVSQLMEKEGFTPVTKKVLNTEPAKAKALSLDDPKVASVDPKKVAAAQAEVKTKAAAKKKPVKAAPKPAPKAKEAPVAAKPVKTATKPVEAKKAAPKVPAVLAKPVSGKAAKAKELFDRMNNADLSALHRNQAAKDLLQLKKVSKVSWISLGFTQMDVPALIEKVIQEMTALLSAPKAKEKAKAQPKPAPVVKATKTPEVEAPKAVTEKKPAPKTRTESAKQQALKVEEAKLDPRQKRALSLLRSGKAKAEVSRSTNISTRSLGRLLDKFGK